MTPIMTLSPRIRAVTLLLSLLSLVSCQKDRNPTDTDTSETTCPPGDTEPCACEGAQHDGTRTCTPRGDSWTPCACSPADTETSRPDDTDTGTETADPLPEIPPRCEPRTPGETASLFEDDRDAGRFDSVDILVVVDDSGSMREEQEILATSIYSLINTLMHPLPTATHRATDDIRIAVVTSDMGLQWGGNAFDPVTDGWPGGRSPGKCEEPLGRNGAFVTDYRVPMVNLREGVIPCGALWEGDSPHRQCPPDWQCEDLNPDGVGVCRNPAGTGEPHICPPSPSETEQSYLVGDADLQIGGLSLATACMADVGTDGCGFEQQLMAATAALQGDALTTGFLRRDALLVVLMVTDEEDCSMKDGPAIFASPEVQSPNLRDVNIACGRNLEHLYTTAEIKAFWESAKAAVSSAALASEAILFAAIVGVPDTGDGASLCQGKGSRLGQCLDVPLEHGTMGDPGVITRWIGTVEASYYEYACQRFDDTDAVTQANPGTRIVELARRFGDMSYVYSICNEDWSPAMTDIATLISRNLDATCIEADFFTDPEVDTTTCEVALRFSGTTCPDAPTETEWSCFEIPVEAEGTVDCLLPRITIPQECSAMRYTDKEQLNSEAFGWHLCTNTDEDIDDCEGSPSCPGRCRHMLSLTDSAWTLSRNALEIRLTCSP